MEKIHTSMILEILGKPKEYVAESMETLLKRLSEEKGVTITKRTVHEPKEVESAKDLFTTFADLEVDFDALDNYFGIMFAYMPSHIEILEPEKLPVTNAHLNDLGNVLMQRLHNYDAIVKKLITEREIIADKIRKGEPLKLKDKYMHPPSDAEEPKKDAPEETKA